MANQYTKKKTPRIARLSEGLLVALLKREEMAVETKRLELMEVEARKAFEAIIVKQNEHRAKCGLHEDIVKNEFFAFMSGY